MATQQLKRLFNWLIAPVPDYVSEATTSSYKVSDINTMRARDLQKVLKKLSSMTNTEIDKIIDKQELKTNVLKLLEDKRVIALNKIWKEKAWKYTIMALLVSLLFFSSKPLMSITQAFNEYMIGIVYFFKTQFNMVKTAYKQKKWLAVFYLSIALLLDFLLHWMQASSLLSWVVPYDAPVRAIMFPFTFSLPINTDMIIPNGRHTENNDNNNAEGGDGSENSSGGGYGINLAPMIYMGVTRWTKGWFQERGAEIIADYVLDKEKKKHEKKQAKNMMKQQEHNDNSGQLDSHSSKVPYGSQDDSDNYYHNASSAHNDTTPELDPDEAAAREVINEMRDEMKAERARVSKILGGHAIYQATKMQETNRTETYISPFFDK